MNVIQGIEWNWENIQKKITNGDLVNPTLIVDWLRHMASWILDNIGSGNGF